MAIFAVELEIESQGRSAEDLDDVEGERYVELTRSATGEGTLHWDLETGHMARFALTGETGFERTTGVDLTTPDGSAFNAGIRIALEGTLELAVTTDAP